MKPFLYGAGAGLAAVLITQYVKNQACSSTPPSSLCTLPEAVLFGAPLMAGYMVGGWKGAAGSVIGGYAVVAYALSKLT